MTAQNLLIVDDEYQVIKSIRRLLKSEGYQVYTANSGFDGLQVLQDHDIGVILSDVVMPRMNGVEFLEKCHGLKPDTVRILLTAHASLNNAVDAVNLSKIYAYLTKPWVPEDLKRTIAGAFEHYEVIRENKRLHEVTDEQNKTLKKINRNLDDIVRKRTYQLEEAVREGVLMLAMAAEAKDDDTGEHVIRIQNLTKHICRQLGMPADESDRISFFSIMHDVGKIHIPDKILQKAGPLNQQEWQIMQSHTIAGEKILGEKSFYKTARKIARSHHERWDGNGYPDKLKGTEIPIAARIVAVADVYDALTHKRHYKDAWPVERALHEIQSSSATAFDPEVVAAFMQDVGQETSVPVARYRQTGEKNLNLGR